MKMKDQIIKLRSLGYSYARIQDELGCSKGTISYHCGDGQKEKCANRQLKNRSDNHPLIRKIENFIYRHKIYTERKSIKKNLNRILRLKIEVFSRNKRDYKNMSFTISDFLNKVGDNPSCCLTGRPIDLMKPNTYQLDHIIPKSKGGLNTLDNCQLLCKEANQAKNNLLIDEFIKLCRDVVNYQESKKTEAQGI
jgi:5-methylcytosine-specific restriction endonuclease McrA